MLWLVEAVVKAVAAGLPPRREDDSIVDADAVVVVVINKTKRSARLQAEMIILEFIIVACELVG